VRRREFLRIGTQSAAAAALAPVHRVCAQPRFTSDPFTLGVASGYPTADGIVLWTRLAPSPQAPGGGLTEPAIAVRWELASDPRMRRIVRRGTEEARADAAFSVHVEPHGLAPATEYWYRFTAGDAQSPVGRTRTAPAPASSPTSLRLAVASCQQYEQGYYAAYRHMLEDELDLIVHLGDYIYENSWAERPIRAHGTPEAVTLEDYRRRYALYRSDPDLAAAHAACPWLVTWDDHEVDNDYANWHSELADDPARFLERRAAAYQAFYEHMPLPRAAVPSGHHMRLYAERTFGGLATICMLDGRQHRSPQACPREGRGGANRVSNCTQLAVPARTMLGSDQEQWLQHRLAASRTPWNLIAQGVVMSHIDEDPGEGRTYWTDSWNGYPHARERLLHFLDQRRIANPVVLSGDIHTFIAAVLNRSPEDPASPAVACELVTSSVSSLGLPLAHVQSMRALNPNIAFASSEHRGYLRLRVTPERLHADLVGVDDVSRRDSGRRTLATFVVESGRAALLAT
jgi:alkaline phosphatase D